MSIVKYCYSIRKNEHTPSGSNFGLVATLHAVLIIRDGNASESGSDKPRKSRKKVGKVLPGITYEVVNQYDTSRL